MFYVTCHFNSFISQRHVLRLWASHYQFLKCGWMHDRGTKIITKAYQVTSWLHQQVNTFPRAYRFGLGDRIASTALNILEGLVEASHLRDKRAVLDVVDLKLKRLH